VSNVQQISDRLEAVEVKLGLRKAAAAPQTEVQAAEDQLAAAIKRAKEKAA
jgi:hypothetical protein